jgi:hypothetical protein
LQRDAQVKEERSGNVMLETFSLICFSCDSFQDLGRLLRVFENAADLCKQRTSLKRILTQRNFKLDVMTGPPESNIFHPTDHIYIGNVCEAATSDDIGELIFSILGMSANRIVLRQKSPGQAKHCFVWTSSIKYAARCINAINGLSWRGRELKV